LASEPPELIKAEAKKVTFWPLVSMRYCWLAALLKRADSRSGCSPNAAGSRRRS
jgi:hypothetical protein